MLKYATPAGYNELRTNIEEFLKLYKENKAVLIDIRMPFEKKVWGLKFTTEMTPEELESNLDKLPKDKLIVTACPGKGRSPFAAAFLKENGFNAKFLEEGLLELMAKLKGGEAKKFLEN
ncbi:sulfurtransferase [Nautilia sp. PV-1]|jgi:rhodanese-related sulfurtransferase|uniref:rhodanese-like domain-containing protein n=1 Tax=Nautilia sp. PV-1 TaxID=2579250 RepID=UPI000FD794C6|nr:rhodanese-like domain-containing protein [Nautilia sp. PV-1]AZV46072.1 sulfurtransferase [Nautilia sp. PV-1]